MGKFLGKKKNWAILALCAVIVGFLWTQKEWALSWYYVRQLSYAYPENRDGWAKRAVSLDEHVLPRLLQQLHSPDALICDNMQHTLCMLAKKWGTVDPRSQRLVERMHERFEQFSLPGQEKALLFLTKLLQQEALKPLPPAITQNVFEITLVADAKKELKPSALFLAAELVDCVAPGQWVSELRGMAEQGMTEKWPNTRIAALHLIKRAPMRHERSLLVKAIPLLTDTMPIVRRAALLALAPEVDVVREEHFLPLLHDDDIETQYLCEMALRRRNLTDDDIRLARLISHKDPAMRMTILRHLPAMSDLNLAEWLRQLSNDRESAVRAAAVRAAGDFVNVDLSDRLREMAEHDPSETVRQNARHYLQHRTIRSASVPIPR